MKHVAECLIFISGAVRILNFLCKQVKIMKNGYVYLNPVSQLKESRGSARICSTWKKGGETGNRGPDSPDVDWEG